MIDLIKLEQECQRLRNLRAWLRARAGLTPEEKARLATIEAHLDRLYALFPGAAIVI